MTPTSRWSGLIVGRISVSSLRRDLADLGSERIAEITASQA